MILFTNMYQLQNYDFNNIHEIWCIVRSYKNKIYVPKIPVYHIPELSPSLELFQKYLNWKSTGKWNEETFISEYVPQFLQEMKNPQNKNALLKLYNEGQHKNIICVCYCSNEKLCHRSIILGILQGAYEIMNLPIECKGETLHTDNFKKYYQQYMNL